MVPNGWWWFKLVLRVDGEGGGGAGGGWVGVRVGWLRFVCCGWMDLVFFASQNV